MPQIGPTGAHGPQRAQQAEYASIGSHAFAALGAILGALLSSLQLGYLPKLSAAQDVARMFSSVNNMLTGGDPSLDADWENRPGPKLTNEENMSQFLKAWIFFHAATGAGRPEGVTETQWKEAKELLKHVHLSDNLLSDMKQVLNDPAYKQLAQNVIANSKVFAEQKAIRDKRRALFKGHPELEKQYDKDLAEADDLRRQIFELDPESPTYKEDKAKLEKELATKEGDMRKLAGQAGVTGSYDSYTKQIDALEVKRVEIMTRVRDEDIPAVQKGRLTGDADHDEKIPDEDKSRYNKLSNSTQELTSYADGALASIKALAEMVAMKAGKLAPILSKIIKDLQKVAEFIIHSKLNES